MGAIRVVSEVPAKPSRFGRRIVEERAQRAQESAVPPAGEPEPEASLTPAAEAASVEELASSGRRPPFAPGNAAAVTHGAYSSVLANAPRVLELADEQRAAAPWLSPADEAALRIFALGVARLELMSVVVLASPGEEGADVEAWAARVERNVRLSQDARGWLRETVRLAHELGLTPPGRAAMEERDRTVLLITDVQPVLVAFARIAVMQSPPELRSETQRLLEAAASGLVALEPPVVVEGVVVDEGEGS